MIEVAELHCQSCLDGQHHCRIYTTTDWEGGGGRCPCKRCTKALDAELSPIAVKVPQKRGPKPGSENSTGRRWTDSRLRELLRLSAEGLSSRQIAELVDSEMSIVRRYIKKARTKGLVPA